MNFGFLFWLFLIGIMVAVFQDLKRREIDDWLNLLLIFTSFSFIIFKAIIEENPSLVYQLGFLVVIMFSFMNLFYYGRVFAGGDAKLLFALTALFIGTTFVETLVNAGSFLLFLMIAGSVYGLTYSLVIYFRNFGRVNKSIKKEFRKELVLIFKAGLVFFILGFFNIYFFLFGIFTFLFPLLYIFTKGLENVLMIKVIKGKDLREGDWLFKDVKVGRKIVKANWDGVSVSDIKLMKDLRFVKIRQGMAFAPSFLIAFLIYVFLQNYFLKFIFGVI